MPSGMSVCYDSRRSSVIAEPETLLMQNAAAQEVLLETAEQRLLAPFEIEQGGLERVFRELGVRRIDYSDLYFQYTRSEGWSLEESIVKSLTAVYHGRVKYPDQQSA